jgi:CRP-like cAMP-binding protein
LCDSLLQLVLYFESEEERNEAISLISNLIDNVSKKNRLSSKAPGLINRVHRSYSEALDEQEKNNYLSEKLSDEAILEQRVTLSELEWEEILSGASEIHYLKNDLILKEGESNDSLYQVMKGSCRAERSINGKASTFGIVESSELFGECSFILETDQEYSIYCNDNRTTLYRLRREYLNSIFSKNLELKAKFYRFLCYALALRLHYTHEDN